jgi:DNA repair protein SbcC/Rad50
VLTTLEIENYQSIRKASLELGGFTVITGPTGSGKTALLRAVRLLAFNARGDSYVSRGQKSCKVAAGVRDEGWAVGIERGKTNCYRVSKLADRKPETVVFTKLAGGVPEAVEGLLRLTKLNFAGQFDSPYLLESSAAEVARVLGQLTNVTMIFEAAREANRRKARLADQLKDREAELERLRAEAQRFASLPRRLEAARQAEEAVSALDAAEARIVRLRQLVTACREAQAVLEQTEAAVPEAPSLEAAQAAVGRWALLRSLLAEAQAQRGAYLRSDSEVAGATERLLGLERQHHAALADAGVCPVCGQKVR